MAQAPVVLTILDGWGIRDDPRGNAPALAATPNFDRIHAECPRARLITHGRDVGLPEGQMGNSEVGHMNIGAGRVVSMDLGRIDLAIDEGRFGTEAAFTAFIDALKTSGGRAHLIGLVSDGNVHASDTHLVAAATRLHEAGLEVVIHAITDGRDVGPKTAVGYLTRLAQSLPGAVRIGTLTGRYYAMDRDNRWERVETAYRAMAFGAGQSATGAVPAVEAAYAEGITDEFIPATVIGPYDGMRAGDGLFCLNFRSDRARELLAALLQPDFNGFDRGERLSLAAALGMVSYSKAHDGWMKVLYPKEDISNTLGAVVAAHGKRQFRLAETEKYPHVTFFLNGGKETAEPGEDRYMAPSPKVATYDLQPEMSAPEVGAKLVEAIGSGYDLIVVNFANPDMVGHTGDLMAAKRACEAVDAQLGLALDALKAAGGAMIVTADHGNCEMMIDPETSGPHTAHTLNPVDVILVGGPEGASLADGRLADLAPTLLALMGLPQPDDMTGRSLIEP